MSRFLSPAKICIVILIDVYASRQVQPADTIHLLSLISRHILPSSPSTPKPHRDIPPLDLKSLESFLSPLTSNFPGRSLYDVFLQHLWAVAGLEQLDQLFDKSKLEESSTRHTITPTSPIGQYLRKCRLEFFRLQFCDAQQLYEDFVLFREPTWDAWSHRHPQDAAQLIKREQADVGRISTVLIDRQNKRRADGHETLASQDQLALTIQKQLDFLQTTGTRIPEDMQEQLAGMVQHAAVAPADVHFIKFFDAWRAGCYTDALDCLHRYFDYAMEGHESSQSIKTYHQYALLHLAVLHADFGRFEEAISAMEECIATARENQDARCLNFGLSWLVHLRKSHPDFVLRERISQGAAFAGSDPDILFFLQQKAIESKDWMQLSSALLSQAESVVQENGNMPKALEYSFQSYHLNLKHSLDRLQPTQTRLHGALFHLIGAQTVANSSMSLFKTIHAGHATQPELLGMQCMHAYHLIGNGRYDQAMQILREADPSGNRTLKMQNTHLGFANICRFKHALHRNELFIAGRLLPQVQMLRTFADPDVAFETHVLELEYLRKTGRSTEAFEKITKLFDWLNAGRDKAQIHRIKLLIIKANLWAHVGRAAKGFSVALRAANAAYIRLLQPLLWAAVGALAGVLDHMQEFAAAQQLLDSIIPKAVEGSDLMLVAQLYSRLTDAYVGQACKNHAHGSKERTSLLSMAQMYLERAKEAFDRMEDVDGILACLEKKAMLFRYKGDESLAEEMERMYEAQLEAARQRENEARGEHL